MKYENLVMFSLIGLFVLTFIVVIVQSYQLKTMHEDYNDLGNRFQECKLNELKTDGQFEIIKDFRDEITYSDSGLFIEHTLSPRIEVIK